MRLKNIVILFFVVTLTVSTGIFPRERGREVGPEDVKIFDYNPSFDTSTITQKLDSSPLLSGGRGQAARFDGKLEQYIRSGSLPEGIRISHNKPNIIVVTSREANIEAIKNQMDVKVIVDLGKGYLFQGTARSPEKLQALSTIRGIGKIDGDYLVDFEEPATSSPGPQLDQFQVQKILGVDRVEEALNINGNGVIIGIADSGVDFGVADLQSTMARDDSGIPISFDPSGYGLALTNHTVRARGNLLPIAGFDFDIWTAGGLIKFTDLLPQRILEDLDITGVRPSQSGDYKVGILAETGGILQLFLCVLVDPTHAHQYDTLYIDFDTSLALSLQYNVQNVGRLISRLLARLAVSVEADFSLADEQPHTWGGPGSNSEILARDIDGDGFADVSAGALTNTLDYGELFSTDGEIIRGIRADGAGFAVMWDSEGHGTSVAGNAAGQGIQPFTVYDDWYTRAVENNTAYVLPGMARGATIAATKAISKGSTLLSWLWLCGFDRNIATGIWEYTGRHKADVINNSFGDSDFELDGYGNSWAFDTLAVDLLSVPGIIHPTYPGTVFVISAGNGGPGYGTVTSPASATTAISVGASTSYHILEAINGPSPQGRGEVAPWSARGPASVGTPKPDIVNIGEGAFSITPLWEAFGDGSHAYGLFGGTSQAAPLTTGVCALIIEALKNRGDGAWSPDTVRYLLKSTAKDLGYEPVVQGAGRVDAYRAVQLALGNVTSEGTPLFTIYSTTTVEQVAPLLNDAFAVAFGAYNEDNMQFNVSSHPGLTQTFRDTSFFAGRLQPGGQTTGTITAQTPSGASITAASALTYERSREETHSLDRTRSVSTAYKLETYFSPEFMTQLSSSDLVALYLTYDPALLNSYVEQNWEPPYIFLEDWNDIDLDGIMDIKNNTAASGEIRTISSSESVANILSMYIGDPKSDFRNSPAILIHDDGFAETRRWNGMIPTLTIELYNRVPWNWVTVTQNKAIPTEWSITVEVPTGTPPGSYQGFLELTKGPTSQLVPMTVSVFDQIPVGPNTIKSGGITSKPLDPGGVYGSFDWSWRAESGDYRIYNYELAASDARYVVTNVTWEYNNTELDAWVVAPNGAVLDKSDIILLGGGRYNSTTTKPAGQILVSPVNTTGIYTVVVHCTKFDGRSVPEPITLAMSYLTTDLPTPTAEFSVPDGASLNGPNAEVSVTWDPVTSDQLPELKITETSISVFVGESLNTTGTIDPQEDMLIGGWFETAGEVAEDYVTRDFRQGDLVQVEVGWTAAKATDLDIFIWGPNRAQTYANNLIGDQMATDNNPERGVFIVPIEGTYTIGIDWFSGARFVNYYVDTDDQRGVTSAEAGRSATIDTQRIGQNGELTIRAIAHTDTNLVFQKEITVTAENFVVAEFPSIRQLRLLPLLVIPLWIRKSKKRPEQKMKG